MEILIRTCEIRWQAATWRLFKFWQPGNPIWEHFYCTISGRSHESSCPYIFSAVWCVWGTFYQQVTRWQPGIQKCIVCRVLLWKQVLPPKLAVPWTTRICHTTAHVLIRVDWTWDWTWEVGSLLPIALIHPKNLYCKSLCSMVYAPNSSGIDVDSRCLPISVSRLEAR